VIEVLSDHALCAGDHRAQTGSGAAT